MAGKFLGRDAIIDSVKSEHRTNAMRRRTGLIRHPIRAYACGCNDPTHGAFHLIDEGRTIPTREECKTLLKANNKVRKLRKRRR